MVFGVALIPTVAVLSTFAGIVWRRQRWRLASAVPLVGVCAAGCLVWLLSQKAPHVNETAYLSGVAVGTIGLIVVPAIVYFALGRLVAGRALLSAVWLLTLPLLGVYALFIFFAAGQLLSCPPSAHECLV